MLNNIEKKEPDVFEQEMKHRIANLNKAIDAGHVEKEYITGVKHGYAYALATYREYRKDGRI